MLTTIAEYWELAKPSQNPECTPAQLEAAQRIFYAGAGAILDTLLNLNSLPDEQGEEVMHGMFVEFKGFITAALAASAVGRTIN